MTAPLADMTRDEQAEWLWYQAPFIMGERAMLEAAVERYTRALKTTNYAYERSDMTEARHRAAIMEAADHPLAEEVRRDLGLD